MGQGNKSSVKIQIGISACLMGEKVRYNGGHKQSKLCLNTLSDVFDFHPFCPESAAGFGTPRPTMRLIGDPKNPRLHYTAPEKTEDLTQQLVDGFKHHLPQLNHLSGYILIKNSPSCGATRVKVYQDNGHPHQDGGEGIYAKALRLAYPLLPIEEEGRLHDPHLYENFILRVYAHHRFHAEVLMDSSFHGLIQFHSRYKYILMAHNPKYYRSLGHLLANANKSDITELSNHYLSDFMQALKKPASTANHANALMHLLGHLKKSVSSKARQDIVTIIHQYRQGNIPLITPLTLMKHYIEQSEDRYARSQHYFDPYPEKLGLMNRI